MELERFSGKSILVAGATGGLGRVLVRSLLPCDCSLMLIHQEGSERSADAKNLFKGGRARISYYECDFTSAEEIRDAIDIFFEQEKEPYAFVNLLGDPARVDWKKGSIGHFQDAFLMNASAPLFSAKEFGLQLRSTGRSGAVVLFSSMQAMYPFENSLYYGTAKAALIQGVRILGKEFGGNPFVRVNAIAPGVNQAGMALESIQKGKYEKYVEGNIIPSYGEASQIARLALFLIDPDLYMTGQAILYDGGLTLRRDLL